MIILKPLQAIEAMSLIFETSLSGFYSDKELKRMSDVVKTESLKLYHLVGLMRQKLIEMKERRRLFVSDVKILTEKALELGRSVDTQRHRDVTVTSS